MNKSFIAFLALVILAVVPKVVAEEKTKKGDDKPGAVISSLMKLNATVENVDYAKRTVTLKEQRATPSTLKYTKMPRISIRSKRATR